jgi:hypothetical protein
MSSCLHHTPQSSGTTVTSSSSFNVAVQTSASVRHCRDDIAGVREVPADERVTSVM